VKISVGEGAKKNVYDTKKNVYDTKKNIYDTKIDKISTFASFS
jgi:hypothetical protein